MLHSPQQAEEVYVETFLRVARTTVWEERGTVRGYLFTIAHRLCLDILRQRKVTRLAVPHLVELAEARPPTPSPEALGLDEDQVNSQVSYARKRLRTWMEEREESERRPSRARAGLDAGRREA